MLGNSPSMTSNLIFFDLCKLYLEILPIFFFAFLFINELNETGPFFPSIKILSNSSSVLKALSNLITISTSSLLSVGIKSVTFKP